jgi:Sodium:dicarboxylate symporter family
MPEVAAQFARKPVSSLPKPAIVYSCNNAKRARRDSAVVGFSADAILPLFQGRVTRHPWNLLYRGRAAANDDEARAARLRKVDRRHGAADGYTFNADGTSIYMAMAAIFIAQATNTHLSVMDQIILLGVLLLTSKGSAGVAGAGFVTLAATLSSMHTVPVAGLVLLLGVDRFMNEARAVTNLIGNGVATIAVAKWEGAFDAQNADEVLRLQDAGLPAPAPGTEPESAPLPSL